MTPDDALYSRIHLTLNFKALDRVSRKGVRNHFPRGADFSAKVLATFAEEKLDGRQIKNIMKMARLLAKDLEEPLSAEHIDYVPAVVGDDIGPVA